MTSLVLFHNTYRCTGPMADKAADLVLLHGWGLHSIVWDDIMPGLLEYFRVTVIDLPGMGQSPMPAGDYTLDYLAQHVGEILPPQCHLMGWSLGGLVALRLASERPQQVLSLTMVAATPKFVAAGDWPGVEARLFDRFMQVFDEDVEGTLIRFLALNCKDASTVRDDVRKLKDILYFCGLPAPRALRGGLAVLRDSDLREELAALSLPRLMLFGEFDNIVPPATADMLAAQHEVCVLKDVSHVPFVSQPEQFINALKHGWRTLGIVKESS
ncbi:pimeloyl-ACP methyl ester esterase BioH [Alcanivorax sp. 1008]|uniref:pimeloyl-ACP methyl ester esterase BioH n=1 Tax=Alcanivorax sp. 1008 TaxID=2816853 RepID=UPI001D1B9DB3|nr:pimeloyl-ACP methyl ester esterase BioH [Alcanivorax sp. 1008]MCC1498143.1 pimeloyl-ACP methyl ester esterase BioH [Alcanivorax sp. 1008]